MISLANIEMPSNVPVPSKFIANHPLDSTPASSDVHSERMIFNDNSNNDHSTSVNGLPTHSSDSNSHGCRTSDWDDRISLHKLCNDRTAGCRSEVGRKCYSLPNRYRGTNYLGNHSNSPLLPLNARQFEPSSSIITDGSAFSLSTGIPPESFLKKLSLMKAWFKSFSDVQRNRILREILDECGSSQIHLISVWLCGDGTPENSPQENIHSSQASQQSHEVNVQRREKESVSIKHTNNTNCTQVNGFSTCRIVPASQQLVDRSSVSNGHSNSNISLSESINIKNLPPGSCKIHLGCIPNCLDPLTIFPSHVSLKILSYLDPTNLARASQVSRTWLFICSSSGLWRRLAQLPKWKLSPQSHQTQLLKHTHNDQVCWKEVMVERWRVRRNWVGAHCHVRTFSGHTEGVTCVQFDQHRIVSASHDNTIKVWSMKTNSQWPVQTLMGHSGRVRCLHLSNNRVVSGSADTSIKVWEVEETSEWSSIVCRVTMVGHSDTVRCLQAFGDDLVLSGSYDCTIKLWRLPSGNCEKTLRGHEKPVFSLAVVEELDLIVSGSDDNTIKIWSVRSCSCPHTLHGHTDAVTSLSADVYGIISGSLDSTIRSWDIYTGECRNTLDWMSNEGHTGVVRCVAADEGKVVSASDDKTIKVWERSTLKRLVTLRNHTDGVTCLAFNEFLIVSGSYDKTVKLWDFSVC